MINKILIGMFVFILSFNSTVADAAFKTKEFSSKQKEEIEKIVYDYLLENPTVILDAIKKLKENEEIEKANLSKERIKINQKALDDVRSPVLGNKKGDIVIYHFFDYNCGYCKVISKAILKLAEDDKRIKIMMKDSPIFGEDSENAAAIALFADSQGKFKDFYEKMMGEKGKANKEAALKIIKDLKLDVKEAEKFMNNEKNKTFLEDTKYVAMDIGIESMPTTLIGGELFLGALEYNKLKELVDKYTSFVDGKEKDVSKDKKKENK